MRPVARVEAPQQAESAQFASHARGDCREAHARQAQIVVRCTKNLVSLRIRDDGRGFAAAKPGARKQPGLGLLHMRERTELAGGTFSLQSEPGRGTAIRAHFPLNGETNAR